MTRFHALAALGLLGFSWATTVPLTKVAVSSGHHPIGLIFWQLVIAVIVVGAVLIIRRRLPRISGPFLLHCLVIALLGTILPNSFSYLAIAQLPAGIMAIIIATVPMFALLIALSTRAEGFQLKRFFGVMLGGVAVAILAGPDASLPEPEKAIFVLVALVAPFCYGLEGNYVAWRRFAGHGPTQTIFGASAVGVLITGPLAWYFDLWVSLPGVWQEPEQALVVASTIHAFVYAGYIWLVGVTSAVFASQIAYVVTLGGVFLSALLLGEQYSAWAYGALALMLLGLVFVQPRERANREPIGQ